MCQKNSYSNVQNSYKFIKILVMLMWASPIPYVGAGFTFQKLVMVMKTNLK